MSLTDRYNFPEAKLGPEFAQDKLKEFRQMIDASLSFVVLSMPGVGVSYFLRYLVMLDFACVSAQVKGKVLRAGPYFIHVDLYDLPTLSRHEFYKLLLSELGGKPANEQSSPTDKTNEQLLLESKKALQTLSQKWEKIVIVFSRFDQLKAEFDCNLLSNIQSLTAASPGKIVLIFTSTKPLNEIAPDALSGGNLNFYSRKLYFKPYSKEDLKKLLEIEPAKPAPKAVLEKLLELSGGHNQLLHILLNSQKEQLLLDQFVRMQMKEFVNYLNYYQRKQLQKIALGRNTDEADEYLLGVGLIKKSSSVYQLFTPLLKDYIKNHMPAKLPAKEAKLFKLLRRNMGSTVTKYEIFQEVWGENNEIATDWALDALVYRLRKHPFMKANSYIIESHKKVGYTLVQT